MSARRLATCASVIGLVLAGGPRAIAQDHDPWLETRGERSTLAAFVTPYLGRGLTADTLVGIEARAVRGVGAAAGSITLRLSVAEAGVSRSIVERVVELPVADTAGTAAARPFLTEIPLAPGRYELRLREGDAGSSAASLVLPFEVPSPARPPQGAFSMSALALTSSAVGTPAAGDASEERRLFSLLLRPPSPWRRFAQHERIESFIEIYDWDSEPGFEQQFNVRTTVRRDDGSTAYTHEEMGTSERLESGRFGYAHSALIPAETLPPGRYLLEVAVESLLTGERVARSTAITVEPSGPALTP